jgi:radical SAM protein with 4Fe4S-binding SPASM domain
MPQELFAAVAPQLAPLVDEIALHLMGEPLLHPDLAAILENCRAFHLPVNLTTNGTLLDDAGTALLLDPIVRQVNFSVHAFEANFGDADPRSYLEPILHFIDRAAVARPDLYINLRMWDLTDPTLMSETGAAMRSLISHRFQVDLAGAPIDVRRKKRITLRQRVFVHFDARFIWPALDLPFRGGEGFCHGLGTHFGVLADGRVVPCCLDHEAVIELGNINHEPLMAILESERARRMRCGFEEGVLHEELCRHCPFISRFARKVRSKSGGKS